MYICMYVYIFICIYIYVHICTCKYICVYIHIHVAESRRNFQKCVRKYMYMYINFVYICIRIYISIHIYCAYIYKHTFMYTYMYDHIYCTRVYTSTNMWLSRLNFQIYIYVYTYIYINIYICPQAHTRPTSTLQTFWTVLLDSRRCRLTFFCRACTSAGLGPHPQTMPRCWSSLALAFCCFVPAMPCFAPALGRQQWCWQSCEPGPTLLFATNGRRCCTQWRWPQLHTLRHRQPIESCPFDQIDLFVCHTMYTVTERRGRKLGCSWALRPECQNYDGSILHSEKSGS